MHRAAAFVVSIAVASATTSCATYEGSRDTAVVGGVTFASSMGLWIAGDQVDNTAFAFTGLAVGTASMMMVLGSAVGMAILPKRVEIALRIAHELVVRAESGDCVTVSERRHEVEELDGLVYEVVLMEDPEVQKCFDFSSSSRSSSDADRDLPDQASTSIVQ
jgi:hypothetical protein